MTSVASSASTLELCPGETATIQVDGDFVSVEWSNGSFGNVLEVMEEGNYSAVVYDANGCAAVTDIYSIDVVTSETPQVAVIWDVSFCAGASVDLIGTEADDWSRLNGEITQSIIISEARE